MAFDSGRFMADKFAHRTEIIKVPQLKDWFDKGDDPTWEVRGLTASEITKANEVAAGRQLSTAILEGLLTKRSSEVKEAITKLVGRSDEIPEDMAKKIEHLRIASINPICSEDLAIKLAKVSPTIFFTLANAIWQLSGQGMSSPGKSKPFGKVKKSKAH